MVPNTTAVKICFIAPKAYPLFNHNVKEVFGGAEVDLYFLATELAKDKGFEVSFITADYGQKKTELIEGVRVIKSLDFNKNPISGAIKLWQAMRTASAQIYFQETSSWGTFLVALFCRLHHKKFIYRTASQRECDGTYLKQHYFAGKAFRWALHHAAQVVVQTETGRMKIKEAMDISSIVIPNAHRLPVLKKVQRDTILWVGRSTPLKRPGLFIELAEKMPGERFTMICQCATGDRDYQTLVKRAKRVKNLQFIERVAFSEINSYFQRAKIFINTSDSEGFPNTFIQACKCATPILSFRVNPDNFLSRFNCGICADDQAGRFLDSLEFILSSKRYLKLGLNARKYVQEHHDITRIIRWYKTIFVQLARVV